MDVIQVQDLVKVYPGTKAVAGANFSVQQGEIFGLLGPNGAGKTTTLEIIEGIKPATSGSVHVLGLDVLKNPKPVKARIGVQLQSSEYFPLLTLSELITLFASVYGVRVSPIDILGLVDLKEKAHARVGELSGGQKQRFTIATALVHKPDILFLDEPTTGLDPAARRNLWALIKKLNSDGVTIVLTTHYMEEAEYLCHRIAIIDQGKIIALNQPKALIAEYSLDTQVSFIIDKDMNMDIQWLQAVPGVREVHSQFPKVVVEVGELSAVARIIEELQKTGVSATGFTVKTANLEDVYLSLTGHEYEA
jgi:ABC-2 type transport system ATP-binding protein